MAKKCAFSFEDMKNLFNSNKQVRKSGRNDRIEKNRGGVTYYLFDNEIAHYDPENKTLTVTNAGWFSVTTKDRLNGLLCKFGCYIQQKDGEWFWVSQSGSDLWRGGEKILEEVK